MRGSSLASASDSQLPLSADRSAPDEQICSFITIRIELRRAFPWTAPPSSHRRLLRFFLRSWKENDIKITRLAEVRFCNLGMLRLSPPASWGFFFFFVVFITCSQTIPVLQGRIFTTALGVLAFTRLRRGSFEHTSVYKEMKNTGQSSCL